MASELDAPRRYRMTVERVDPMSVLRMSFLLSVAFGIAFIIGAILMWLMLDAMHVFAGIDKLAGDVDASGKLAALLGYTHFGKAIALSAVIAVLNTILMTVAATLGALIYNVVVRLVGGISLQLIDE